MLKLKKITLKNFLSIGNVTQSINLNENQLTLVIGENLDLGGGASKNGVGKSSILQAICYALYGWPLTSIKKDNLINKTNAKNMVVTLDFEKNGKNYRIERGRKPNVIKWVVDNNEIDLGDSDDSEGDSKWTQKEITKVIGLSLELFKQIVALNTFTEPFLSMKIADQRTIIEELLGVALLSQKADKLKEMINGTKDTKGTKDIIKDEEYELKSNKEYNTKIENTLLNLRRDQQIWEKNLELKNKNLSDLIIKLSKINIDDELNKHNLISQFKNFDIEINQLNTELNSYIRNITNIENNIKTLETKKITWTNEFNKTQKDIEKHIKKLSNFDLDSEIQTHKNNSLIQECNKLLDNLSKELKNNNKNINNINITNKSASDNIKIIEEHNCPTCGQEIHDDSHKKILKEYKEQLKESNIELSKLEKEKNKLEKEINDIQTEVSKIGEIKETIYSSIDEAYQDSSKLDQYKNELKSNEEKYNQIIKDLENQIDKANEDLVPNAENWQLIDNKINNMNEQIAALGEKPSTHYKNVEEVYEHKNSLKNAEEQLKELKIQESPYDLQLKQLEESKVDINYEKLNELTKLKEHQEFLLKLLIDKNSFVRKKIIDQNLNYLNHRLFYYLEKLGLPHEVKFLNDLSVEISELGRELDFDNLSRGERTRLILGLSWAFRDIFESLNSSMNLIFIDEILDNGMDQAGMESSLELLKKMGRERNKNIFLISHRDELLSRVTNVLQVVKENGFTNFETGEEIEEN